MLLYRFRSWSRRSLLRSPESSGAERGAGVGPAPGIACAASSSPLGGRASTPLERARREAAAAGREAAAAASQAAAQQHGGRCGANALRGGGGACGGSMPSGTARAGGAGGGGRSCGEEASMGELGNSFWESLREAFSPREVDAQWAAVRRMVLA